MNKNMTFIEKIFYTFYISIFGRPFTGFRSNFLNQAHL